MCCYSLKKCKIIFLLIFKRILLTTHLWSKFGQCFFSLFDEEKFLKLTITKIMAVLIQAQSKLVFSPFIFCSQVVPNISPDNVDMFTTNICQVPLKNKINDKPATTLQRFYMFAPYLRIFWTKMQCRINHHLQLLLNFNFQLKV